MDSSRRTNRDSHDRSESSSPNHGYFDPIRQEFYTEEQRRAQSREWDSSQRASSHDDDRSSVSQVPVQSAAELIRNLSLEGSPQRQDTNYETESRHDNNQTLPENPWKFINKLSTDAFWEDPEYNTKSGGYFSGEEWQVKDSSSQKTKDPSNEDITLGRPNWSEDE